MGNDAKDATTLARIDADKLERVKLTLCLGLLWSWMAACFFGTIIVGLSPNPSAASDTAHLLSLVAYTAVTLCLLPLRGSKALSPTAGMPLACIASSLSTVAIVFASPAGGAPFLIPLAVAGIGEALMLYYLCISIREQAGDQTIIACFAGALAICGLLYVGLYAIGGVLAGCLTAILPLAMLAIYSKLADSRCIVCPTTAASLRRQRSTLPIKAKGTTKNAERGIPWTLVLGFSTFGLAFGFLRCMSPDQGTSFSDYYLAHELCRGIMGLVVIGISARAKNPYWAISTLGSAMFALSFVLAYAQGIASYALLVNITATAGFTCFELLMWTIIYRIASETNCPLEAPLALGRGFSHLGITVGALSAAVLGSIGLAHVQVPAFQTAIVVMLLLMLTLFSNRDASELWGAQKSALRLGQADDERLSRLLVETFQLSTRESDVALLLAKGRSEPFIAECLSISRSTVHSHAVHIYLKAGVHSRQELLTKIENLI